MAGYVELHAHSHFSFLDGASSPQELIRRAADLSMPALALTDHGGLYGMVRFMMEAREAGIQPIVGAELTTDGGGHLTLLVQDASGFSNLCRLISRAQLDHPRGEASLAREQLEAHHQGLIALSGGRNGEVSQAILRQDWPAALETSRRYAALLGLERFFIEVQRHLVGAKRLEQRLIELAEHLGLGIVATNDVHYATPAGRPLQDVLTGIRHTLPIHQLGSLRRPNAEFYLKSPEEMQELFADLPAAIRNSAVIAERCQFDLDLSGHRLPKFRVESARATLRELSFQGVRARFPQLTTRGVDQLEHELAVIRKM